MGLVSAFTEFCASFEYAYRALGRRPPKDIEVEAERKKWVDIDKQHIFMGRFADRNLQKRFEDVTTDDNRPDMTFTEMSRLLKEEFTKNANTTLANYKFRQLSQESGESFDNFVIRVKREAKNCKFACSSGDCTVPKIMIRDQLVIGTNDQKIRQRALEEQWEYDEIIKKGRTMEAGSKGAESIRVKQEPGANRTHQVKKTGKAGKYSKNTRLKEEATSSSSRCKYCRSSRCTDRDRCPAKNMECFICNKRMSR